MGFYQILDGISWNNDICNSTSMKICHVLEESASYKFLQREKSG